MEIFILILWRLNSVWVGNDKELSSSAAERKLYSSLAACNWAPTAAILWRQTALFNDGGNGLWCSGYANLGPGYCLLYIQSWYSYERWDNSIVPFLSEPPNKHENCKVSNFKQGGTGRGLEQKTRRDLFLTRFKNHKNNLKLYRHQKILQNCRLFHCGTTTVDDKKLY